MNKQLVIIPGLGDRGWVYSLVKPLWKMYGYTVHVFVFGWEDKDQLFDVGLRRFADFLDDLPSGDVYVIGASAGGTVAVQSLAMRPKIVKKVVTICTPYQQIDKLKNKSLRDSLDRLGGMVDSVSNNVLSLYSTRDRVVPETISKHDSVKSRRIFMAGHWLSIAAGITVYAPVIRRFFRQAV